MFDDLFELIYENPVKSIGCVVIVAITGGLALPILMHELKRNTIDSVMRKWKPVHIDSSP